jgi:uncharacterized protein
MHPLIINNRDKITQLLKRYDVVSAYLFGSAVGNSFNEKSSDIDLLIKFNPDLSIETYANNYFNLLYALQYLLKKNVDLVAEETLSNPFLIKKINTTKIALL